jgi:hypothetical protein
MTTPRKYSHKAFPIIWILLGIAGLFGPVQRMNASVKYFKQFDASALIPAAFSMLALITGVAFIKAWPFSTILICISGLIILIYCLAVITMGVEDVGGPFVAVPFGIAGIAFGIWSILIKRRIA